jgi:sterol desaturase/sphingolipid hydroxylase (fatty acid hydroxylase superfamily)
VTVVGRGTLAHTPGPPFTRCSTPATLSPSPSAVFHYAQHHAGAGAWRYLAHMKRYHMKHHFADVASELGFGVTSKLWDVVFGTLLPLPELPSRPTAAAAAAADAGGSTAAECKSE